MREWNLDIEQLDECIGIAAAPFFKRVNVYDAKWNAIFFGHILRYVLKILNGARGSIILVCVNYQKYRVRERFVSELIEQKVLADHHFGHIVRVKFYEYLSSIMLKVVVNGGTEFASLFVLNCVNRSFQEFHVSNFLAEEHGENFLVVFC